MSKRPAEPKGMPPNPQWGMEKLKESKKRKEPETQGPTVEEVEDDDDAGKKEDEMVDIASKDPAGFPKEELEEAKKREEGHGGKGQGIEEARIKGS